MSYHSITFLRKYLLYHITRIPRFAGLQNLHTIHLYQICFQYFNSTSNNHHRGGPPCLKMLTRFTSPESISYVAIPICVNVLILWLQSLNARPGKIFHSQHFIFLPLLFQNKGTPWEGNSFLLLYKHIETGHSSWTQNSDELWLMQGFALS